MISEDRYSEAEQALNRLAERAAYDERNRLALLLVHALTGILAGLLITLDREPASWLDLVGPGHAWWLGAPPIVGGILLAAGLAMRRTPRIGERIRLVTEAIGMTGIMAWDAAMIYVIGRAGDAAYPVAVYAGLAGLMSVHMVTLGAYIVRRSR